MNNMEEKLWDYIDGTCSEEERVAIAALIEKDAAWQKAFNDMTQMNNAISEITLDEPSMAFSYKVIERIRAQEAIKPLQTTTNTYVIGAIAGFFILAIIVIMMFLLVNGDSNANVNLPAFSVLTNSSAIKAFFYADVILLLFLVDAFLRRKRSSGVAKSV
jgi:anti-sigma factor RsiW